MSTGESEPVYFVYMKGVGNKPCPQIWYGDQTTGTGEFKHKDDLLFFKKLEGGLAELPLKGLVAIYPPPGHTV